MTVRATRGAWVADRHTYAGTHCVFLHSALSVRRVLLAFAACSDAEAECSSGNIKNLPVCLFTRATINFSVFTCDMISLTLMYYKYA